MFQSLISGFVASVRRFPSRKALVLRGSTLTYEQLSVLAAKISAAIEEAETSSPLVAVLAHRSETAYGAVLGILASRKGYVPLHPRFPSDRLKRMLLLSGCDSVIVGPEGLGRLKDMLGSFHKPLKVILTRGAEAEELRPHSSPEHRFLSIDNVSKQATPVAETPEVAPESVAYLLFTSGSTGDPKGVAVSHANVTAYVRHVCELYGVTEHDRVSQHFDLTFDLSVHDMFVCWERGACLCSIPEKSLMMPAKFIKDHELTMWFSVPSLIGFMRRLRMLKHDSFPSLRCSLFCGEPLPAELAEAWQQAAPNSILDNLYGPTEATIAITRYRWGAANSSTSCFNGIVPIGWPFDGQKTTLINPEGEPVSLGEEGELVLSGSQVTAGYWKNPETSQERFVSLPAVGNGVWYRTGDLAKQSGDGCLHYMGRLDDQIKIRGFRVELQEIDHVVRTAAGTPEAVAVPWPVARGGSVDGVVAFVCGEKDGREAAILDHCRRCLPEYMVPRRVCFLDEFPLNVNRKVDRKRLAHLLKEREL